MNTITIPATAEATLDALGSLGRLINARKWERAALIASLVGPAPGSGRFPKGSKGENPTFDFTPSSLAGLGLVGLRDRRTVAYYRDVWHAQRPTPGMGETLDLDDLPDWPGVPVEDLTKGTGMSNERRDALLQAGKAEGMPTGAKAVDVAKNPKALAVAIKTDPATAKAARAALREADKAETERLIEEHPNVLGKPPETADGKAIRASLAATNDAVKAVAMPVFQAAMLLKAASEAYEEHAPFLPAAEERQTFQTLHDLVIEAETFKAAMTLKDGVQS